MRQIAGIRVLGRVMPEIARVGHCLFWDQRRQFLYGFLASIEL